MKRQYFGTDGVRGPYGGPVINESFAARLGAAAGRWIGGSGRVVIGRDTRASGESLAAAVARGLASAGLTPVLLGAAPTPAVARAVRTQGAVLGVVITASHNPACDNGIKLFSRTGVKLTDEDEAAIEQALPSEVPASAAVFSTADVLADYMAATGAILPAHALRGWKIVLDTANGATCATSPAVLRALGAEVIGLGDSPDGKNINAGVGSEHPGPLAQRVREVGARLGIAHDGDGDRCILCDERGEVLDGDEILTILATHAHRQGKLAAQTLVVTVQSNLGVDAALGALGGRVARTDVGDRYVIERMFATGATLGGESSGHIICSEISPTGDGLVAALKTIEVMLATGRPLSELRGALAKFPQRSLALKVREKRPLETLPTLPRAIEALERELGSQGRVLVRYSGTEAKLRLLVEGPTDAAVQAGLAQLEAATRSDLEVL
ncbi:MAG TPA: phosphoglucosamine mutase [Opitutaceae bacterium]|nr:phosphoglucosamine mutase [Opitutaceae bacterium]HOF08479.1 phosphoglucosamine mutase [Opitutaceae bacterium]HOR23784.1 phosphoglucosamine mutase [Opitutaceae bacterium]HPK48063.1 phosphoglucosamine mutase [Opitutaceae bacterium]HQL20389.1 phosphoglucosamine mutase [Opitutaceae bacterium]